MADRTLNVQLNAKDNMSGEFRKVGDAAKTMGATLENVGKRNTGLTTLLKDIDRLESELKQAGGALTAFGAALTASIAVPMAAGTKAAWDQVDAVQQATGALRAYEQDASAVEDVLQGLLAYARSDMGVLFQREELFAAAQGLRVMGAETENLVRYVEIMSRSVGVGAGNWAELNQVIGRVGSTGRLTGVEFDNLTKMGFSLDESMRNTIVTWEELFAALDRGIPADAMLGNVETIRGQTIRLQSAIRELGVAFLQIDRDTSQFIEGGLGDTLYRGLGQARELMVSLRPAAEAFGSAAATVAGHVADLVTAFNALPQPIQTAGALLTGTAGFAMTAAGAFLLLLPRIAETARAFRALAGAGGITRLLAAGVNPLSAGVAALTVGIGVAAVTAKGLWDAFKEGERVAANLAEGIDSLNDAYSELMLRHEDTRASLAQDAIEYVGMVEEMAAAYQDFWFGAGTNEQWEQAERLGMTKGDWLRWLREEYSLTEEESARFAAAQGDVATALQDPAVSAEKLFTYLDELYQRFLTDEAFTLDDFVAGWEYAADNMHEFRVETEATSTTLGLFVASLGELGQTASEIATIDDAMGYLNTSLADGSLEMERWLQFRADLNRMAVDGNLTDERAIELTIEFAQQLDEEQRALEAVAAAGALAATATEGLADAHADAALAIGEAGAAAGEAATDYIALMQAAEEATAAMGAAAGAFAVEEVTAFAEWVAYATEAMRELTNQGDYLSQLSLIGLATEAMDAAKALSDVGAAMDSVLGIFGQIDAMGSRMSRAGAIADYLFGEDGDPWDAVGPMRDVLDAGLISWEQFTAAIEEGIAIQTAAAESQVYLDKMRVDQLPLLRETTEAYYDQIVAISELGAAEQMVALGWMDGAMQARVQQFVELGAGLRALGDEGEAAMQQVVDGIAATDPVLTQMLLDLGLIEEAAGGDYTINMDAVAAMDSTERLIEAIEDLTRAMRGLPPLDVEVTGWEDVWELQRDIEDLAADTAEGLTIDIATRLQTPGDGTGGADYDVLGPLRDWVANNPVTIPTDVEDVPPERWQALAPDAPIAIPVTFLAPQLAGEAAGGAAAALLGGTAWEDLAVEITISQTGAEETTAALDDVTAAAGAVPEVEIVTVTAPGAVSATTLLNDVTAAANAIPEAEHVNVFVYGAAAAVQALNDVAAAAAAIPDTVSTTITTNRVTNWQNNYLPGTTILPGGATGGLVGNLGAYATGGLIPFIGGEVGPEVAHFATGGTAMLPGHGVYAAPAGTYISPHHANPDAGGGLTVLVEISGGEWYGFENVTERVTRELAPAIGEVARTLLRQHGVKP